MKFPLAIFALALGLLASCGKRAETERPKESSIAVKVAQVRLEVFKGEQSIPGTVQAKRRAVIEAKAPGVIESLAPRLGTIVKSGELLVQLDSREFQARRDQAAANRVVAEADLKRMGSLLEPRAVTEAEFDAAKARFGVAQATLAEKETFLGYTKILAPFDGVITRRLAEVGDLAGPGKPLLEMEDSELRLVADVPEEFIAQTVPGRKLEIELPAANQRVLGQVVEVSPAADVASRTWRAELKIEGEGIRSGMYGRLLFPEIGSRSVSIPSDALIQRGQLDFVYVFEANAAKLRIVRIARRQDDRIEILSGLGEGEKVIRSPAQSLRDGQLVAEL